MNQKPSTSSCTASGVAVGSWPAPRWLVYTHHHWDHIWGACAWDDVTVVENGGRAVAWATLTGLLVNLAQWHVPARLGANQLVRPLFGLLYLAVNATGLAIDRIERRYARSDRTLPMNLLLTARRPPFPDE